MYRLLLALVGLVISSAILTGVNVAAFKNSKMPKVVALVSSLVAAMYTGLYTFQIFVAEGESGATSMSDFMSTLPLFLFIFLFFMFIGALPMSILANAIVLGKKSKLAKQSKKA